MVSDSLGAFYGACVAAMTPPKPAPRPLILQALNIMKNTTILLGKLVCKLVVCVCVYI